MPKSIPYVVAASMLASTAFAQIAQDRPPETGLSQILPSPKLPFAPPDIVSRHCANQTATVFVEDQRAMLYCKTGRLDRLSEQNLCRDLSFHLEFNDLMLSLTPDIDPVEKKERNAENDSLMTAIGKFCPTN